MKPVIIREHGRTRQLPIRQFESDLRCGTISATVDICYPPWTGNRFCSANQIPELWDALDSPQAMAAEHLRNPPFPWLSILLSFVLLGAAFAMNAYPEGHLSRFMLTHGVLGWEETLIKGKWWTPWTSQLIHIDQRHFFFNLAIVAYCGWRVEQAVSWVGAFQIINAAILFSAMAVCLLGEGRVVGSSMLAFGLWGGQIALGFRLGEAIPDSQRGRYGWGNLIFFIPLFIYCLTDLHLSHLGHIGALFGGVLSALLGPIPSYGYRKHAIQRYKKGILLAISYITATLLLVWSIAHTPFVDSDSRIDAVEKLGVSVSIPSRLQSADGDIWHSWTLPNQSSAFLFAYEGWGNVDDVAVMAEIFPDRTWGNMGSDQKDNWYGLDDDFNIWVSRRMEGQRTLTLGCGYEANNLIMLTHCKRWVEGAVFGEPGGLLQLQEALEESPNDRTLNYEMAVYLEQLGRFQLADMHYSALTGGADASSWNALKRRISMRTNNHLSGLNEDLKWGLINSPITDGKLRSDASDWLYREGDCNGVATLWEDLVARVKPDRLKSLHLQHVENVYKRCESNK